MKKIYIGLAILIISVGTLYFLNRQNSKPRKNLSKISNLNNGPCPGETIAVPMEDRQMRNILPLGQDVKVVLNYYACNEIKKGDLVLYRFHGDADPVIRMVHAVPGDEFEVTLNKDAGGWQVTVNDEPLKVQGGQPLTFGVPNVAPPLASAAKALTNQLGENHTILLADSHSGQYDSTLVGVIPLNDVIGKVITKPTEQ